MNTLFSIGIALHLLDKLSSPLRSVQGATNSFTGSIRSLTGACEKFSRGFAVMTNVIEKAKAPFEQLRQQADSLKDIGQGMAMKGMANVMLGLVPSVDASKFEKAMAEVATLTDMSVKEFQDRYGKQVIDLSITLGQDPATVVKGLYQAISAGIDPKDAIDFMRKSGQAAIAGVSDIFTAVDLATSIKNAFNVPMEAMGKVNDIIFQTVRKGKTTYAEIAQSFSQVAAAAGSAGISLEHVQAAVAQMTLSGVKTERAYTSLKYVIDALVAPSNSAKKAFQELGIQVNAEAVRQKDLIGVMDMLMQSMKGLSENAQAEAIADIFNSQEAQMFVKDFVTNTEKYKSMLNDINASAGASETAYKKMAETSAHQFEKMMTTLKAIKIALGASILPVINAMLGAFKSILTPIAEFAQRHKLLSGVILGGIIAISAVVAALGVLGIAIGMAINGYTNLKIATSLLTAHKWRLITALRAMTLALLPNISAMKAFSVSTVISAFASLITMLKTATMALWAGFLKAIKAVILALKGLSLALLTTPIGWIALAIAASALLIYKFWGPISGFFKGLWQGMKEGLKGLEPAWDVFKTVATVISPVIMLFKWLLNGILSLLKPVEDAGGAAESLGLRWGRAIASAISWVLQLPVSVMSAISSIGTAITSFFSNIGSSLYVAGQQMINQLWQGIQSMASLPIDAVRSIASGIRDLLPFSPAKMGPLADLHQVRLIETIADGIDAGSLITRIKEVLGVARDMIMPVAAPSGIVMPAVPSVGMQGAMGGMQTFNISVNVTVNNAEGMTANDVGHQTAMEIEKTMRRNYR